MRQRQQALCANDISHSNPPFPTGAFEKERFRNPHLEACFHNKRPITFFWAKIKINSQNNLLLNNRLPVMEEQRLTHVIAANSDIAP